MDDKTIWVILFRNENWTEILGAYSSFEKAEIANHSFYKKLGVSGSSLVESLIVRTKLDFED